MRTGEGKNLLFLHGYLSCKESFYYQTAYFSRGFAVTAADFPAFGKSGAPDAPWCVGDYALWLKDFMAACGLNGCLVIAHSFGARVALKLFSACPWLCERLIITGGAGLVKPRTKRYLSRVKRYRRVKKFFPRLAERKFGSAEYRSLPPEMRESYKKIVNEDLRACASQIICPTLLIYGADDGVTPPREEGVTFNQLIKNSRLRVMNGGHFCFSEHPREFNEIARGFLTE